VITGNLRNVLERRVTSSGIAYYVSPLLEEARVPHAFSTRVGPRDVDASPPPFDSFNLGNPSGVDVQDDYERIYKHYRQLESAIGAGGRTRCWVHQVHGGDVITSRRGEEYHSGQQADAMVSDDPTRLLSIRTADCVPVLLATSDGTIVSAIHSGWRGIVANVVTNALHRMHEGEPARPRAGPRATSIIAAIGPCIGGDVYEVGAEVLQQFTAALGSDAPILPTAGGKGKVDLREAIRRQLLAAGLRDEQIDMTDRCSFQHADEFYSHRRDKAVTGRMAALISPRAEH
jgi:YfiH family protein